MLEPPCFYTAGLMRQRGTEAGPCTTDDRGGRCTRFVYSVFRHRPPRGRQCCAEEGRRPPRSNPRSALVFARAQRRQNHEIKLPATGRWRTEWWSCADGVAGRGSSGGLHPRGSPTTMTGTRPGYVQHNAIVPGVVVDAAERATALLYFLKMIRVMRMIRRITKVDQGPTIRLFLRSKQALHLYRFYLQSVSA